MVKPEENSGASTTSEYKQLSKIINKLKSTPDPKRKYQYVIWLGDKLPLLDDKYKNKSYMVKGCMSKVFVKGELIKGCISWKGYSDAVITRGLLALLIEGFSDLQPEEIINIDESFISETGLNTSLTPSRANGFLNILLNMKSQVKDLLDEIND